MVGSISARDINTEHMTTPDTKGAEMAVEFLTRQEFAAKARVTDRTLHRWARAGYGPKARQVGAQYRYRASEVDDFLAGR